MATIDRLTDVGNLDTVLGVVGANFKMPYIAQTFKAIGSPLTSVEFLIDGDDSPDSDASVLKYRVLITTVEGTGDDVRPKAVLFSSGVLSEPIDDVHELHGVTVDTGTLALSEGQTYAIVLDATANSGPVNVGGFLGASYTAPGGVDYSDGRLLYYNGAAPHDVAFAADWYDSVQDLAFRLTFATDGVTINGTGKNDKVDATHTVKGQPLPGKDDDTILGNKGKDKLSGLAGNDLIDGGKDEDKLKGGDGDDLLIGGKGKDKLSGEAGADAFRFDVSLKEMPDRIVDFNPVDDTIQLDHAIFSVFTPGALAAASLHIGSKAADADDYLVYNPVSGALLYDSDGEGGHKGIRIATLDKNLTLTSDDFAIV